MSNYHRIFDNPLLITIITMFLAYSTYTDLKEKKIYNISNGLFLAFRFIFIIIPIYNLSFNLNSLLGGVGVFILMLIPAMIVMSKMGGDIKLGSVLGLYFGLDISLIFLVLTIIVSMIHLCYRTYIKKDISKKTYVPYAPYFFIAFLLLNILNIFI